MKGNLFKKIWADPVGSGLISAIIFAGGSASYISIKSNYQDKTFNEVLHEILALQLDLKTVLLIVIPLVVIHLFLLSFRFKYSDSTKQSDIELFKVIKNTYLDQDITIRLLRDHDFSNAFDTEIIHNLYDFISKCRNSDFKFYNPKLERLKIKLKKEGEALQEMICMNTFPINERFNRVSIEWGENNKEEFKRLVNGMNKTADKIVETYDKLILVGRKKLGV